MREIFGSRPMRFAAATLLLQAIAYYGLARKEVTPHVAPWSELPTETAGWRMVEEDHLESAVLDRLQPDDYSDRVFQSSEGLGRVSLFIGYYKTQRDGRAPHSPTACLPGEGWSPVSSRVISVRFPEQAGELPVNEFIVAKKESKAVVLYWYQLGQRTFTDEIRAQLSIVPQLLLHGPSGIALIRVVAPVGEEDLERAKRAANSFVQQIYPLILDHIRGAGGRPSPL